MAKKPEQRARQKLYWLPPKGASAFFLLDSDEEFKRRHPVGYIFVVAFGIIAFAGPLFINMAYTHNARVDNLGAFLQLTGAFCFGIGLFNLVAIIVKQYLGHLFSILCFLIGCACIAASLYV